MRILLSNDDGIRAPGLACLESIAAKLSDDVWVVAPAGEQSGMGHAMSFAEPIRLHRFGERRFSVSGTPADSVFMGIRHVVEDGGIDLVLSGVNRGANVADDITYSGTVAAAMEATLLGVPAIALSQDFDSGAPVPWETAAAFGPEVVRRALAAGWSRGVFVNVNFPAVAPDEVVGMEACRQGRHDFALQRPERRVDPFGRPYFWMPGWGLNNSEAAAGTDLHVVRDGGISVTPIHLDMTHESTLERFAGAFP